MNTKDILMVATTALGMAVLTVATLGGGSMEAGSDAEKPTAKIEQPKFVQNGIQMTLAAKGNGPFKAGDKPVFELTAFNPTDKSASVAVDAQMTAMSMPDRMSRGVQMQTVLWEAPEIFTIQAGETKVLEVLSKTQLPADRLMSVYLKDAEPTAKAATAGAASAGPVGISAKNVNRTVFALSISTSSNMVVVLPGVASTVVKQ